ncbi:hypothetical protein [Lacinutrix himadriensis]|uniref:hypothetical protein n=1 Tax=Lacinutrix himadriensis TaxID=641549 RepID=UPI0006E3515C|nr:hypothetical protein [Lacinutrix himadriensis]
MKKTQKILVKISNLLLDIKANHNELYVLLDENPITIPTVKQPKVDANSLEDYLISLKEILKRYNKNHKKNLKLT